MIDLDINDLPLIHGTTPIADIGYPRMSMPAIFVAGCNFRCPYCINKNLVVGPLPDAIDPTIPLTKYFMSREPWVMVTGAEPLSHPKIFNLLSKIRLWGMKVALATNGSHPDALKEACKNGLVNYVAMDIKTAIEPSRYSAVTGTDIDTEGILRILESIDFLKGRDNVGGFRCEFRMTACGKYVKKKDAIAVATFLGVPCTFVLQMYTTHQTMDKSVAKSKYIISHEELTSWVEEIDPLVGKAMVREV